MAAAIPIISAIIAAASTAYSVVNTVDQNNAAKTAAEAAKKNAALDKAQQDAAASNAQLDTKVQTASQQPSMADQIKAKMASEQQNAPGLSTDFYTSEVQGQYPGFNSLVNGIVTDQFGNPNQNPNPNTTSGA